MAEGLGVAKMATRCLPTSRHGESPWTWTLPWTHPPAADPGDVPVRSACPPGSAPCEKQDLAGLDFGGAAEQGSQGHRDRRGEAAALRERPGRY